METIRLSPRSSTYSSPGTKEKRIRVLTRINQCRSKEVRIISIARTVIADMRGDLYPRSYLIKSTPSTVHNLSALKAVGACSDIRFDRQWLGLRFNNTFRALPPLQRRRMNRVSLGNQEIDVIQSNGVGVKMACPYHSHPALPPSPSLSLVAPPRCSSSSSRVITVGNVT